MITKRHFNFSASHLLMTQAQFSTLVGKKAAVVGSWAERGVIPAIKSGREYLIDAGKLHIELSRGKVEFRGGDYNDE